MTILAAVDGCIHPTSETGEAPLRGTQKRKSKGRHMQPRRLSLGPAPLLYMAKLASRPLLAAAAGCGGPTMTGGLFKDTFSKSPRPKPHVLRDDPDVEQPVWKRLPVDS